MKAYIDEAHRMGMKVKIYYTVRELSNFAPELFALRSLGDEILSLRTGRWFCLAPGAPGGQLYCRVAGPKIQKMQPSLTAASPGGTIITWRVSTGW